MVEGINPVTTIKTELRILAAMDSCFSLVRPHQNGIHVHVAISPELRLHTERITSREMCTLRAFRGYYFPFHSACTFLATSHK